MFGIYQPHEYGYTAYNIIKFHKYLYMKFNNSVYYLWNNRLHAYKQFDGTIKKFVESTNYSLWKKHIKNCRMRQQSMHDKHEFNARS